MRGPVGSSNTHTVVMESEEVWGPVVGPQTHPHCSYGRVRRCGGPVGPSNTHTVVMESEGGARCGGRWALKHTHTVVMGEVRRCGAGGPSNTHTVVMGVSEDVWRTSLCLSSFFLTPFRVLFFSSDVYLTWLDFPGWGTAF